MINDSATFVSLHTINLLALYHIYNIHVATYVLKYQYCNLGYVAIADYIRKVCGCISYITTLTWQVTALQE